MAAPTESKGDAIKPVTDDTTAPSTASIGKPAAQLEEDDEFEDFPVEDWTKEEEVGAQAASTHLWEESWDDSDNTDDFAKQLKAEVEKLTSSRKG